MIYLHLAKFVRINDRSDLLTAWETGRDFTLGKTGAYTSIRDSKALIRAHYSRKAILCGFCPDTQEYEEIYIYLRDT